MWENKASYNGLSALPFDNGNYKQAPFEDISESQFMLERSIKSIDLTRCMGPMMKPIIKPRQLVPVVLTRLYRD